MELINNGRIKAGKLLAIFIRLNVLFFVLNLFVACVAGVLSSLAMVKYAATNATKDPFPAWSLYGSVFDVFELFAFVAVFTKAEKIGTWICGQETELVLDGAMETWIQAILQFIGIALLCFGLAWGGMLVSAYLKYQATQPVYTFDPQIWNAAVEVGAKVVFGIALIVFPAPISKGLGALRKIGTGPSGERLL